MTTTEWVERYNRAFEEAAWPKEYYSTMVFDEDEFFADPMPPNPLTWYCPEGGYWMINGEMIYLTKGEQRVFLANPSPFEPAKLVDDGQEGAGALNRKE